MKFIIFVISFLMSLNIFAQHAPWANAAYTNKNNPTFAEIIQAGNDFFANKDISVKGSGYKQFKRWESLTRHYIKNDGTLMTSQEINNEKRNLNHTLQTSKATDPSNWTTLGPFDHLSTRSFMSGQGRVNTILVSPHNPNEYWIGTPGGGAWQSLNAGQTWTPKTDEMPNLGVSAIAIDPLDPLTIYVGTGDDESATFSGRDGMYKSTDGGTTWEKLVTGSNDNGFFHDIYINPNNNLEIYAGGSSGFIKSEDGGITWTLTLSGFGQNLKVKPGDWSTVYYTFRDAFYLSIDGGDSWIEITQGLPMDFIQRIMIDVSPDAPEKVYAVIAGSGNTFLGLYISEDSGVSFTRVDDGLNNIIESSQAFFDLDIAVNPQNANEIFTGCLNVWRSSDEGSSFTQINTDIRDDLPSYTHADIHQIRYFNGSLFVASDGGIYKSNDQGASFQDLTAGLVISELYELNVSPVDSKHIVAGLQDNGGFAYDGNIWRNWHPADGTSNVIDPTNPNVMHSLFQFGSGYFITEDSGQSGLDLFGPGFGNFETPIAINSEGEIFGANMFFTKRVDDQWVNMHEFTSRVFTMEIAPSNDNIIYASTGVELFRSNDGGINFSPLNTSNMGFIVHIAINHTNPEIIYIVTANISSGGIFRSVDGGQNFVNINSNLSGNIPLRVLELQPNHPNNPLYLGTDFGVLRYDDSSQIWQLFQNGMPDALVRDLSMDASGTRLFAGTFGRGVWETPIPQFAFTDDLAITEIATPNNEIGTLPFEPVITLTNKGQNILSSGILNYSVNNINNSLSIGEVIESNESINVALDPITTRGFYTIDTEITTSLDQNISNNIKNERISLNDFGQIGVVSTFEDESDALISINSNEAGASWERGVPTGSLLNTTSSGSQVYGTNLSGAYDGFTRSYLYTQFYDLTTVFNPQLSFDMALDIGGGHALFLEFSLDGGGTWELLGSANDVNWYNSSSTFEENRSTSFRGGQWTNITDTTIGNYTFDLSPWIGQSKFVIRFVLDSRFNNDSEGVILDNLSINDSPRPECTTTTEWVAGNWTNGIPDLSANVIIRDNYNTAIHGSFSACSLVVDTNNSLIVGQEDFVEINYDLTILGTLEIDHQGNFVQINDTGNSINNGFLAVHTTSPFIGFRGFTILGSPTSAEARNSVWNSAFNVRNHFTQNFIPNANVADLFPNAENFADDNLNDFLTYSGSLIPGEGYLVRPQTNISDPGGIYDYTYNTGNLNNGVITYPILFNTIGETNDENRNASPNILSNPYPSAISATDFINANPMINEVYFWEHNTPPSSEFPGANTINFTMEDISMYNLSGGIAAATGGPIPNDFIATSQGFAVKATESGTATFTNSMRRTLGNTTLRDSEISIPKIWLTVNQKDYNLHSTTLIAFMEEASNEFDIGYDSNRLASTISLYSYLEDKSRERELGIQGLAQFEKTTTVPLGFSSQIDESVEYSIEIQKIEGELQNAKIFLVDNELGLDHDLNETPYQFFTSEGIQNKRFSLRLDNQTTLGVNDINASTLKIYPNPSHSHITLTSGAETIQHIAIYDMQGRILFESNPNQQRVVIDIEHLKNATHLIQIITEHTSMTTLFIKK